jgi:hypothetical protein
METLDTCRFFNYLLPALDDALHHPAEPAVAQRLCEPKQVISDYK